MLSKMNKDELVVMIEEMECCLNMMEERIVVDIKIKKVGRKDEVLEVLLSGKVSVKEISNIVGISSRNVSSQLSYLRKDGVNIATDSKGRKFIEED